MEAKREEIIRKWFSMWLSKEDGGILEPFSPNAVYIESWGPEYHGSEKIRHWFQEWNERGNVLKWEIQGFFHSGDQTTVCWFFSCRMKDGTEQAFDGISLITWDMNGKIAELKEYGCNIERYDPYADGENPVFRDEKSLWF